MSESVLARHPAKFRDDHIEVAREMLSGKATCVLDPFAGVGRVHALRPEFTTWGIEIEAEWSNQSFYTLCGDSTNLRNSLLKVGLHPSLFDAAFTSPAFGNRMADSHDAKDGSRRNTYRHALGRPLHPNNSGGMQWTDPEYKKLHESVWGQVTELPRARWFVLNIKDHIRKGERQRVTDWHVETLLAMGWEVEKQVEMDSSGNRDGANSKLRVDYESMILFGRTL